MFTQPITRKMALLTAVFLLTLVQPIYATPQAERLLEGEIDGANYRIRVPDGWDGQTLVVYAHGYRDKADQPGQTDNRAAEAAPGGTAGEDAFLAAGYAIAGSSYKDNGWAVQEGIADTRALVQFFNQEVGTAQQTILLGGSMGGLIALASGQRYPDLYDGVVALCAPAAGAPMSWDTALAFALAYDVAFGWPESWGSVADVRDNISFQGDVAGTLFAQTLNAANRGKFEFIRLVTGNTPEDYMSGNNWLFVNMFYTTEARAELERRAGGAPTQNLDHIYRLSAADKQYLATLNVDAADLLGKMNDRSTTAANPTARAYLQANASLTGELPLPILTAHTSDDGLVPVNHQAVYRDQVAAAGAANNLFQVYTDSVGHCSFTAAQVELVLAELLGWVVSGERPLTTPFTPALGFLPTFTPPGWPIGFKQFIHLPLIRS